MMKLKSDVNLLIDGSLNKISFTDFFDLKRLQQLQNIFAEINEQQIFAYADEIGSDREKFKTAFRKLPVMAESKFNKVSKMLTAFVEELTEPAWSDYLQKIKIEALELKKNEELFKSIIENSSDLIVVTDINNKVLFISNQCEEVIGIKGEQYIGQILPYQIHPEDLENCMHVWDRIKNESEEFRNYEYRIIDATGNLRWISHTAKAVTAANEFVGIQSTIRNITESKKSTELLRASEEKYRELVENSPDAIVIYVAGIIEYINNSCLNFMAASSPDELIGKQVIEFVHPDSRKLVAERMKKSAIEGTVLPLAEEKFIRLDGSAVEVEVKAVSITYKGKPAVQLIVRDITERKLNLIALENERLLLRTIIDNIPDSIYTKDLNCKKTMANAMELSYLGAKSEKEILGKTDFDTYPDDLAKSFIADDLIVIQKGISVLNREEYVYDENGLKRWLLSSKLPLRDEKNEIIGLVGIGRDITDRKLTEAKIQEKDNQFRKLSANVPDLIFQFTRKPDGSFCVPVASAGIINIFGCLPEDVVDDFGPIERVIHPDDAERVIAEIEYSAEHLSFFTCEFRVLIPDRDVQWIYSRSTPEKLNDGSVTWYGFNVNITERKKAERALIESEKKYHALVDHGFEGIVIINFEGEILFANKSILRTFEYENMDEIIGQNVFQYIAKESIPRAIEDLTRIAGGEKLDVIEYSGITSKGSKIVFESIGKIIEYEGERVDIIAVRDITSRKQTEIAIRESESFLKETQIIANLGTYTLDINSGQWKSSEILDQIFGIDKEYNRSLNGWLAIIHPDWQETMDNYFRDELIGKQIKFDKEYQIIRQNDKAVRWVHGIGNLRFDENKQPVMMLGTVRDITSLKETEQEIIKSKERAEESDRLKSAFLANMSHEIRTPMNGILGFAEILKEPGLSSEQQQEYLGIIEKSGTRMLNIINDIVDISKIESGQMKLSISETNVNEQLEFIYLFFKPEVEQKGLKLNMSSSMPFQKAFIRSDREKLYAILTNLVKNAIKYTSEGTIEIGCSAMETSNASALQFFVKDTGIGIPADKREAIFERFIQTEITEKMAMQGAGLGLAITRAYVEMLQGKIWVESKEGKGSTFYFTIPFKTDQT